MEVDAKGLQKWNQNRCQNSAKINAKTRKGKNHKNYISLNGKIIEIQFF